MNKNIIFCSDGTWDGPENAPGSYPSNVLKLFNVLAGDLAIGGATDPEQERRFVDGHDTVQIAKYIHGVGDSRNWLNKFVLGGGIGVGLVARLLRGYTFLSRNYAPEDNIFLVGFSRGAYTARALGGFISLMGLLDWKALGLSPDCSDPKGYQFAAAAWYAYQRQHHRADQNPYWLASLESFVSGMPDLAPALVLKPKYLEKIPVAAIGVWETVGALGIPNLSPDHSLRVDLLRFADTKLNSNVGRGFHAIAVDEERLDFSPTLWDPDPQRITQCFFSGAHADVGGGYPLGDESKISDVALDWMVGQLSECGIRFSGRPVLSPGSELGPIHLSWTSQGFSFRPHSPREFQSYTDPAGRIQLHPSVRERLGKPLSTITLTAPQVTKVVPYVPASLVNAGYIDVSTLRPQP